MPVRDHGHQAFVQLSDYLSSFCVELGEPHLVLHCDLLKRGFQPLNLNIGIRLQSRLERLRILRKFACESRLNEPSGCGEKDRTSAYG